MSTIETADELPLMTNLYPRNTGLPMVIWVSPSYGTPHHVRINGDARSADGPRQTSGRRSAVRRGAVKPRDR